MTFRELVMLRLRLSERGNHEWDDYAALAGYALSMEDIALLRSRMLRKHFESFQQPADGVWDGDNAGKAALALLTRAGFFDLAGDIRPWLIGHQDPGDQIYTTGPHVLYACTVDFLDGNALRVLLEAAGSDNYDVQLNLARALEELGDNGFALLRRSRKEQATALLQRLHVEANDRLLSALKTFVLEDEVWEALFQAARHGRLYGLLSMMFRDGVLDWSLFDNVRVTNDDQAERLLNAMLENVSRGADAEYCRTAPALRGYSVESALADGLAIIQGRLP